MTARGCVALLGGGGFIGSTFVRMFAREFERVYVVDRFTGPAHSHSDACERFISGVDATRVVTVLADVAQVAALGNVLARCETLILLNADTGTANSFERPEVTVQQNINVLVAELEAIRQFCEPRRTRVLFTSSRAVYGEGSWQCTAHGRTELDRSASALAARRFEPKCPKCGRELDLAGTNEDALTRPLSVYGATKRCGEDLLASLLGQAGFDVRIVRFQNVYGPGQAIKNPYTGVLNWFSLQLTRNQSVEIYEQGFIRRDFIFVEDAARLLFELLLCTRQNTVGPLCLNGGSGLSVSLLDVASLLKTLYRSASDVVMSDKYRVGDVLGARADMSRTAAVLGFECATPLEAGLARYAEWFRTEAAALLAATDDRAR